MVRAAEFEPQGAAITAIAASTRDRTFATAGADGRSCCVTRRPGARSLTLAGTGAGAATSS